MNSFTNKRDIYNAMLRTQNEVRKQTDFSETKGLNRTLEPGTEWIAIDNHEMDNDTVSWYLTFHESNRPVEKLVDEVEVEISFANNIDGFSGVPGGHETSFKQTIRLSELNEYNKGTAVASERGSTVILGGELFNMVHGRYMQVIIRNTGPNANHVVKGPFLTEEGWY